MSHYLNPKTRTATLSLGSNYSVNQRQHMLPVTIIINISSRAPAFLSRNVHRAQSYNKGVFNPQIREKLVSAYNEYDFATRDHYP